MRGLSSDSRWVSRIQIPRGIKFLPKNRISSINECAPPGTTNSRPREHPMQVNKTFGLTFSLSSVSSLRSFSVARSRRFLCFSAFSPRRWQRLCSLLYSVYFANLSNSSLRFRYSRFAGFALRNCSILFWNWRNNQVSLNEVPRWDSEEQARYVRDGLNAFGI